MPMPIPNNEGHQMKRIVLPSGKTIEVVYFESHGVPAPSEAPEAPSTASDALQKNLPVHVPAEDARDLHVCVNCESELVYPVQWEEAGADSWHILLRCPDCEWNEAGSFPQAQCGRFDDQLEAGTEALSRDFKRLVTANMAEEIERFIEALDAGGIQPMDF